MKTRSLLLLCVLFFSYARAQTSYLPLSDFRFSGITARYQDDTTTTYSLLCTGKPNSNVNTDSLIHEWLTAHPDASLRPVCSFSYNNRAARRVTFTYSWLVSDSKKDPILNIYLVRHRAFNANSLLWAKSPSIMKPTLDYYTMLKSETKVFVDAPAYKSFLRELKRAQK